MGLFTTTEEKAKKQEEKELKKIQMLIEKYKLKDLSSEEAELLPEIAACFRGNALIDIGSLMSGDDSSKLWNIQSLNEAIFTQNWLVINQLSKLNKNIEELIEIEKGK